MRAVRPLDAVLAVLGTARLVRLFTEDHLGRWYFRDPIEAWGNQHEVAAINAVTWRIENNPHQEDVDALTQQLTEYDESRPWTWQKRLSEGASCRWCVGFWLGVLVLAATVLCPRPLRGLLRFGLGALSLNLVANAVGRWTGTLD